MPPSKPRPARKASRGAAPRPNLPPRPNAPTEVVDPVWLAKALGLSLLAALLCAWLTVCLLFYQGDWQLVLHPSRTVAQTPASLGVPFEAVRFDASETGQPRLTAWQIPAAPGGKYAGFTVLYLHDGAGSLGDAVPALALLHSAGINVFAIDYRGFGLSDASSHPTQTSMAEDSAAALAYLTATRHIPASAILLCGAGLGASLAVSLAHSHPEVPAIILEDPNPDPTATALAANSSNFIPVRVLFHQRFEIAAALSTLTTPKLLIAGGGGSPANITDLRAMQALFKQAASPSFSLTLPMAGYDEAYRTGLTRFLDQYLAIGTGH
jgi:uncharacterized protein